ncbi:hypothetical protein AVEN_73161-1, partial [Araneus ventricosus]
CDCGPNGSCSFEYGVMKCNCEQGFVSTDGKCTVKIQSRGQLEDRPEINEEGKKSGLTRSTER